jgi:hypothetical protein
MAKPPGTALKLKAKVILIKRGKFTSSSKIYGVAMVLLVDGLMVNLIGSLSILDLVRSIGLRSWPHRA